MHSMARIPKREYLTLLVGDLITFGISLWVTLVLRSVEVPTYERYVTHLVPFSLLFVAWVFIFFLAGLYAKYTRLMRSKLPSLILYTQTLNIVIAAAFFFLVPLFGIAPKTILAIYLVVSSLLIFAWRVLLFPLVRPKDRAKAVLVGTGDELHDIKREINGDPRYPFVIDRVLDTGSLQVHEATRQLSWIYEEDDTSVVIADPRNPVLNAALPLMYDAAFRKYDFTFIDIAELYENLFERVPLSLVHYAWVLGHVTSSSGYAFAKRIVDIIVALPIGVIALITYPWVALAIKLEDGGPVFITQERVGQAQQPIHIYKFRSMSGNDGGNYGAKGKTTLTVTRVGKILRTLRIDELPQIWNVLRGDLSLVGPRPELPSLASQYSARIPFYNARHLIKPGLTGWAQIKHDRHPHGGADVAETKNKLSYDLYYLRHRSFLIDVYIMFQTARIVLFEKGS